MFDAGSTGTRIHIYTFVQKNPGKTLCQSMYLEYVDLGSSIPKEGVFSQQSIWEQLKISSLSFQWSSGRWLLSICAGVLLWKYLFL